MSRRSSKRNITRLQPPALNELFQVKVLATKVISVLRERTLAENALLCDAIIDRLLVAITNPKEFDANAVLMALRAARLSHDDIVSCYIPEAARHLGCRWTQSDMTFAEVTIASARLQDLVRIMSSDWTVDVGRKMPDSRLAVLLVICDNDTHTLGCATIGARLRYAGHSVRQIFGATQDDMRQALRHDWYDLILFSCGRPQALETVKQFVNHIRATLHEVPPMALGGLVLPQVADAQNITGVDLATNDLQLALKLCDEKRVQRKLVAE